MAFNLTKSNIIFSSNVFDIRVCGVVVFLLYISSIYHT